MGDALMTADTRRPRAGLGRGLASLIPVGPAEPGVPADTPVREVPIERIVANPYQPRTTFDDDDIAALAASIATHGVLQPVLLTETPDGLRLIAGERRLRAASIAGLTTIPAVVRSADEQQQLALALVENLQRSDLNALDEAVAFRRLIDEFGLTQEQVAHQVGRTRAAVANTIRLLAVAPELQDALRAGRITEGHARALAGMPDHPGQVRLLAIVEQRGLSVRQTEQLVRQQPRTDGVTSGTMSRADRPGDPDLEHMTARLRETLGTKVVLTPGRKGGRIIIDWYESDDLARLYERLVGDDRVGGMTR
jgi:ParB family chromosome partitioning protein